MTYMEELEHHVSLLEQVLQIPDYFKERYLDFKQEKSPLTGKKIAVIGDNYYSLYVKAYGMQPVFLSGGSYFTGEYTEMFPQISDPVAKSAIGLLLDPAYKLTEEIGAVVMVAVNDSYKKAIAYLKDLGVPVVQVEPIPYIREGKPFALYKQQLSAINDISKLKVGLFNESAFKKEVAVYSKAYEIMEQDSFQGLPNMLQSFFTHVLHTTWDKEQFCQELENFLEGCSTEVPQKQITIMGSAITAPNCKLFQVCRDIGIHYMDNQCERLPDFSGMEPGGGTVSLMKKAFAFQHKRAYLPGTVGEMDTITLPKNTGGIIYYLLKGQISEAYEVERMEELAIEQGIPFLCVETDYTMTDSEQMKIRVEAFFEMLSATEKNHVAMAT